MIDFKVLRAANEQRQKEWDRGDAITLLYRANELAGEVGEACNVVKKLERERLGIPGSRASLRSLADELADVIICADLVAMQAGIDLAAAVAGKFNATSDANGMKTRLPAPAARVHNHGPESGAGLLCVETRGTDGQLRGACMMAPAAAPVCVDCGDTHRMPAPEGKSGPYGDGFWMCTRCPTPCQKCRAGGNGPFCEKTPCACECHRDHWQYRGRQPAREPEGKYAGKPDHDQRGWKP